MEMLSASLAFCEDSPLMDGGIPWQVGSDAEFEVFCSLAWVSWTKSGVAGDLKRRDAHAMSL